MTYCPVLATDADREYAWRHAFCYADPFVSTDDAIAYANHYAALIADEEFCSYWPEHGPTFAAWQHDTGAVTI